MCFVHIENAFDRVPRKMMEWAMRKKGLPEVIVRVVMSLYHGAKTKDWVGSKLSEEFLLQVGVHQGSVLSPLPFCACSGRNLFANAREGLMNKILYADDFVLISESIKNLNEKFFTWEEAFESKKLKVNFKKTKVMVSGLKDEVFNK